MHSLAPRQVRVRALMLIIALAAVITEGLLIALRSKPPIGLARNAPGLIVDGDAFSQWEELYPEDERDTDPRGRVYRSSGPFRPVTRFENGMIITETGDTNGRTGKRTLFTVWMRPGPPEAARAWIPLCGGLSLTAMFAGIMLISQSGKRLQSRGALVISPSRPRMKSVVAVLGTVLFAIGAVGVNAAGWVYRPTQERSELGVLPSDLEKARDQPLTTYVWEHDGAIVGYRGEPGEMKSPPFVIRRPIRSFWVMHWAKFASAAVSLLVPAAYLCSGNPKVMRAVFRSNPVAPGAPDATDEPRRVNNDHQS